MRRRFSVLLGASVAALVGSMAIGSGSTVIAKALRCPGSCSDVICGTGNNCKCDTTVSPALCETTAMTIPGEEFSASAESVSAL